MELNASMCSRGRPLTSTTRVNVTSAAMASLHVG